MNKNLKIIKTANARYKVNSIAKASDEIQQVVAALGGYISEMRYQHNAYQKENKFVMTLLNNNRLVNDNVTDNHQGEPQSTVNHRINKPLLQQTCMLMPSWFS